MPLSVSETSLVSNVSPVYLESPDVVFRDDLDASPLDLEEYRCPNRELVNLENAAVNIDNSNDVIIGPVTQFNVSGNVTIYQNGRDQQPEAINGTVINREEKPEEKPCDDDVKTKTAGLSHCLEILYVNRHNIRNLVIVFLILLAASITAVVILVKQKKQDEEFDYEFNESNYGDLVGEHKVFYRKDWGGKPPKKNTVRLTHPIKLVIISHSTTHPCEYFLECAGLIQKMQSAHLSAPYSSVDVGYNFMIGGDGNIYVGRGWDIENFHRNGSIGINFIGDFNFDQLYPVMTHATESLIAQGLELKKLSDNYIIVGENQTNSKMYLSPGENVYKIIKDWPHFYNKTML